MTIELRPYQEDFLNLIPGILERRPRALIQAPTGAGKTVMAAELIKHYMGRYPDLYIGLVVHRLELVNQNRDKLLKVWPEGLLHVGTACASLGKVEVAKHVTVGSVQTMDRRRFPAPFDLLIIDEAHHVPAVEDGGLYHDLINGHAERNPALRVLGVTATPFRLGHGYIFGDKCQPGKTNFFPSLDFKITLDQLIGAGYLVPWRGKQAARLSLALDDVKIVGGEYNLGQLGDVMSKELHVKTAVETYETYGEGRESVLVFAVTIDHALRLAEAFRAAGHTAAAIHSEMPMAERTGLLEAFERDELRFLINVGILTEGWDSPKVDCVIMCRPTMSPGLFVQMLGRGTRPREGKEDVLILDLADNFHHHGNPSAPLVVVGRGDQDEVVEPPYKVCPACQTVILRSLRVCPECCHKFEPEEREEARIAPEMTEVRLRDDQYVVKGFVVEPHTSRKGVDMCVLRIMLEDTALEPRIYMAFSDEAHPYFRKKSIKNWRRMTSYDNLYPESACEAVFRQNELVLPSVVTVYNDEKVFLKVKELD
jgi:DNA repair protein RadD